MKGCIKGCRKRRRRFSAVKNLADGKQNRSRLTSSKGGVVELPAMLKSSPSSILALFGEEARGLVAGVDL
jgi:CII-binding regulator of phage lambda lysogenization HflD